MSNFECADCDFIAKSSQGLGVHRSKVHYNLDSKYLNIVSVSVIREYPERKSYCCICNFILLNFSHFKRHFKNLHNNIDLLSSAICSACGKSFSSGQGAGVHIKRSKCGEFTDLLDADEPIMSYAKYLDDADSCDPNVQVPESSSLQSSHPSSSNTFSLLEPVVVLTDCTADMTTLTHTPSSLIVDPDSSSSSNYNPSTPPPNLTPSPPLPIIEDLPVDYDSDNNDTFSFNTPPPLQRTPSYVLNPLVPDFYPNNTTSSQTPSTLSAQNHNTPTNILSSPSSSPSPNNPDLIAEFQNKWSAVFSIEDDWQQFSTNCEKFAEGIINTSESDFRRKNPAPRRQNRPSAKPVNPNRRPIKYNPIEARKLQSLYRISKKRAARKVLSDSKPSYAGSVDDANQFFTRVFGPKDCDIDSVKSGLNDFVPSGPTDNHLADHLTSEEVKKKLRVLSNSAPGSDRVEYRNLRSVDPKCKVLCSIFNRCLDANDVPSQWKTANTILIHKKGDASQVVNFRPIALMSCIYKLFMSVIANRLVDFAIHNDLLSHCQKSARPPEGCYEHTFILQSLLLDVKRLQKNVCLAWLDLRNAFGSVPHDVIKLTLSHLGVPQSLVDLIANVYNGASTIVRTPVGDTPSIPILSGVKQGCPLSPILFNLSVEIILRAIMAKSTQINPAKHHGLPISVLAYADNLVLISRDMKCLQQLLDVAGDTATLIGLEFRPDKCASLCTTYSKRVEGNIQHTQFTIPGRNMSILKQHEHYRYLGVPIGMMRDVDSIEHLVDDLCTDLERINLSLLSPWQKLAAIRTFVQPSLTFALRAGEPEKSSLVKYRQKLIEVVRNICNLPTRATQSIIFASTKVGGLALQDPLTEADIQTTVQAIKMLSSTDPLVSTIAKSELKQSVRFAARSDPSPALIQDFLSGSNKGPFHPDRIRYRTHSLWTRPRKACRNLNLSFHVPDFNPPYLTAESGSPILAKLTCTKLHHICQHRSAQKLLSLPDQGKVARALINDTFGNGFSWLYTGLNIRFKDWRFIHRARLNLVPTNQNKHKWDDLQSPICRVCNTDPETLPQVLCHCPTNFVDIRERHNAVLNRLAHSIRFGNVRIDQQVPDLNDECRPDIVIEENNEVTITDVVCPFDNGNEALKAAEDRKVNKYSHLTNHFSKQGKICHVFGFVIGALGTWHPGNETVLNQIRMTTSYRKLFRKLCCSDAIKHSADIYYKHISNQNCAL